MGNEQNRDLVLKTWGAIVRGDVRSAFASMSDAVTWTIPGTFAGLSGVRSGKEEIIGFLRRVAKTFPAGLTSDVRHIYADGDTVILEMTNRGTTATGRPYINDYCFIFEVEGGRIRAIREYVDTQKAAEVFGQHERGPEASPIVRRRTSRSTGPGLALLAPAGERARWAVILGGKA